MTAGEQATKEPPGLHSNAAQPELHSSIDVTTLDVREIPKPERHGRIHAELDKLAPGETLQIVADHEPVHLRRELDGRRPGEVEWLRGEMGPERWTVLLIQKVRLVDARPIIAKGEEPFETIMAAVAELADEDLVVAAPFEPTPLEGVLGSQGFSFEVHEVEPGHWRVRFHREG